MSYLSTWAPRWDKPPSDTGRRIYSSWQLLLCLDRLLIDTLNTNRYPPVVLQRSSGLNSCTLSTGKLRLRLSITQKKHEKTDKTAPFRLRFQLTLFPFQQPNFSFGNSLLFPTLTHSSLLLLNRGLLNDKYTISDSPPPTKHLQTDQCKREIMVKRPKTDVLKSCFSFGCTISLHLKYFSSASSGNLHH